MDPKANSSSQPDSVESYDAPQVESVLTPEEVERQVHYAGEVTDIATN
jgi:hypothetical protein